MVPAVNKCPRILVQLLPLALAVACASGNGKSLTAQDLPTPKPDWVPSGHSDRYPTGPGKPYVTGFQWSEGDDALATARKRAAGDLASRLEVQIEAELLDVSEERDGEESYHVAAVTRSTVNLRLTGVHYHTWRDGPRVYALAYLQKAPAAQARRVERDLALDALRSCMEEAERLEYADRESAAVQAYERCRLPIAEALEHTAVAGVLTGIAPDDREARRELLAATHEIEEKVDTLLGQQASDLTEAAEALALQLGRQGLRLGDHLVVAPFTYGTADLSSSFGRQAAMDLESAFGRELARGGKADRRLVVAGVYTERQDAVRIDVTVKEVESARLVASAATSLDLGAVPKNLELKPQNFAEAVATQSALAGGEAIITGDLRLEVWTSRGRRGVVLSEGDSWKIFMRANQPAYVRLLYVLQDGQQVPIDQAFRIGEDKVNEVVEYPRSFEVVPPFGVEHVHATAYTREPPYLPTRRRVIDGEPYEVVVDGMGEINRTRGLRVRTDQQIAESFVAVTTTPNALRR